VNNQFHLFATVKLTQDIELTEGGIASSETIGTIVEVYNNGEAYEVELFGNWVKYDRQGNFIESHREDPDSFVENIGIETVYPDQIYLVKPASETVGVRARLAAILDELSEERLGQLEEFADFLRQRQKQGQVSS